MSLEWMFKLANATALFGWLNLLVYPFFPKWASWVGGRVLPMGLSALYTVLLVANWGTSEGGFGSLAEVMLLFTNAELVLLGWVHYLAFDLFIGAWQCEKARQEGLRFFWVVPCLFFTLMAGPLGLLVFQSIRALRQHVSKPTTPIP